MKEYSKPEIKEEVVRVQDVIAESGKLYSFGDEEDGEVVVEIFNL